MSQCESEQPRRHGADEAAEGLVQSERAAGNARKEVLGTESANQEQTPGSVQSKRGKGQTQV